MRKPITDSQDPFVLIQSGLGNGYSANGELAKKFGFTVDHVVTAAKAHIDRAQSQMAAS